MTKAKASLPAADNIPLRLRRRRDGTLALTDVEGRVAGAGRAFPSAHVFTPTTVHALLADDAIVFDGDEVVLELVNGQATYRIDDDGRRANGELVTTLVDAELFDAPPVDESAYPAPAPEEEG